MQDLRLTAEQRQLRALAARVAHEVYAPRAAAWDRDRAGPPPDEVRRLADLGSLGIALSEDAGGQGSSLLDALTVIEELAKVCRPAAFQVFEANVGPIRVVEHVGTPAQRAHYLPRVARGEVTMAIAISEPDAGSAATDLRTVAKRDGDEIVLHGAKRWISGGGHATHYLVYARMDDRPGARGIGAVIVPADTPGVSFGGYARQREQFGRPLVEFQNVQMTVADMSIQVEAARLLIHRAAARPGLPDTLEVSLATCYAYEMAKRVSDLAMQLHGGNGYTEEYGIERLHRDAHGWAIAGGIPAIQRIRVASEIFGRTFSQRPAAVA